MLHGCLYLNALASFPDNKDVRDTTVQYKKEPIKLMAIRSGQKTLSNEFFLLHEGASVAEKIFNGGSNE